MKGLKMIMPQTTSCPGNTGAPGHCPNRTGSNLIRTLKYKELLFSIIVILSNTQVFAKDEIGFVPLFNGKDLSGWHLEEQGGFRVEEGILITDGFGKGSDLFSENAHCNYILRFDFMLSKVGNSGVLLRCDPEDPWSTGYEVQLLAPWTPWRDDLHCTASIYGHVPVTNRPDETTGRWYQMEIVCDRKNIIISVDGETCTIANMDGVESLSNKNLCGAIGLQVDHAEVENQWARFRNVRIRDLDHEPAYVVRGFQDDDARIRKQAHSSAVKIGTAMIGPLADLMASDNPVASNGAKRVLFDIVARISAPDVIQSQKIHLKNAIEDQIQKTQSDITKSHLIWLLGMIEE